MKKYFAMEIWKFENTWKNLEIWKFGGIKNQAQIPNTWNLKCEPSQCAIETVWSEGSVMQMLGGLPSTGSKPTFATGYSSESLLSSLLVLVRTSITKMLEDAATSQNVYEFFSGESDFSHDQVIVLIRKPSVAPPRPTSAAPAARGRPARSAGSSPPLSPSLFLSLSSCVSFTLPLEVDFFFA